MPVTIRTATPNDVPEILAFIRGLAKYERAPDAVTATEADLLRDGFGPNPYYFCMIAELDGRPAGFAFYFFDYSTWLGRPGLYLEDIFVHPEFRGQGIGKALLERLATIAVVDSETPSPIANTRASIDSVRPTVATASAPSRPTQNTSTTANRDSSTISKTMGTARRKIARFRLPAV